MEAVIHQPLGHILHLQSGTALDRPQIEDALVGHPASGAAIEHGEGVIELLRHPVGRQQGHGAGLAQTSSPHHADVHPADRQDRGAAPGSGTHRPNGLGASTIGGHGMARQEGQQMFSHGNRPDPRATAAMGNAEGLVQI